MQGGPNNVRILSYQFFDSTLIDLLLPGCLHKTNGRRLITTATALQGMHAVR